MSKVGSGGGCASASFGKGWKATIGTVNRRQKTAGHLEPLPPLSDCACRCGWSSWAISSRTDLLESLGISCTCTVVDYIELIGIGIGIAWFPHFLGTSLRTRASPVADCVMAQNDGDTQLRPSSSHHFPLPTSLALRLAAPINVDKIRGSCTQITDECDKGESAHSPKHLGRNQLRYCGVCAMALDRVWTVSDGTMLAPTLHEKNARSCDLNRLNRP